jgi:hypothetical protein
MVYGFINTIAVLIIACPCFELLHTHVSHGWCWERSSIWSFDKKCEALENMNKVNVLITDQELLPKENLL